MIGKPSCVLLIVTAGLLTVGLGPAAGQETPIRIPAGELKALDVSEVCPVSGQPHRTHLYAARYRGRIYYTCDAAALRRFIRDPRAFVPENKPHAALFRSPNPVAASYGVWLLVLGLYVVLGLVCGAFAAYVAVQKGLGGARWFAAGLGLNVIGVALAFARPAGEVAFARPGLTKIPTTHDPVPCPACGRLNHPSATECGGCGAALEPAVESEVARAMKSGG